MKLGDAVAIVAQPAARGIDAAFGTDLENCSGCAGRRNRLNRLSDSVVDFFARRLTCSSSDMADPTQPKPFFVVIRNKQVLVQADTPEEAEELEAKGQGQTISTSRNVQLRQQGQAQGGPGFGPGQPGQSARG